MILSASVVIGCEDPDRTPLRNSSLDDTGQRYRRWCRRRLDEHDLVYCFLDAIYLKRHPTYEPAEGVLVAWGVSLEGRKVLLGLQLGVVRATRAGWRSAATSSPVAYARRR
jgi:transposase-like protein